MTHPTADSTLASAEETILLERPAPHVALVRLNRPARRNAINGAMARAIEAHVQAIEADTDIRVALIAAAPGPTFCAGADLAEAAAGRGHELMTAAGGFAGFVEAPRRKPWIAAISGSALGGGLEIALSCDMIVCAESSVLGLPEVKRGLIAGAGGLFRLPRALPRALALEMIATGEPIAAARALALGLVNAVVPAEAVEQAALDLAARIVVNAPLSVRESLAIARHAARSSDAAMLAESQAAADRLMPTHDWAEGPRAFVEKRAPQWRGC